MNRVHVVLSWGFNSARPKHWQIFACAARLPKQACGTRKGIGSPGPPHALTTRRLEQGITSRESYLGGAPKACRRVAPHARLFFTNHQHKGCGCQRRFARCGTRLGLADFAASSERRKERKCQGNSASASAGCSDSSIWLNRGVGARQGRPKVTRSTSAR